VPLCVNPLLQVLKRKHKKIAIIIIIMVNDNGNNNNDNNKRVHGYTQETKIKGMISSSENKKRDKYFKYYSNSVQQTLVVLYFYQ
jgi:hypothetical protein